AAGATKGRLHQGNHFVGVGSLFRSRHAAIGNRAFAGPSLVRLMELQSRFVGGFDILPAAAGFKMQSDGRLQLMQACRHLVHGFEGEAIKPRFKRQFFRTIVIAKSSCDDFVHDLGGGKTVLRNFLVGAAEVEFALHEAFQAAKIRIHIGTNVVGGNGRRQNRGQRLLEWNSGFGRFLRPAPPAPPFVARAQQFLMPANLLYQFVEGCLDGRSGAGSFLLGGQLARGQAQIQGELRPLARRILIEDGFQMHQFRPEDVKPLLNLLKLVADFFFDVRSFVDLVTDMNVHLSLERGEKAREAAVRTRPLYTRREARKRPLEPRSHSYLNIHCHPELSEGLMGLPAAPECIGPSLPLRMTNHGELRVERRMLAARYFTYTESSVNSFGIATGNGGNSCETPLNNETVTSDRLVPSWTAILCGFSE